MVSMGLASSCLSADWMDGQVNKWMHGWVDGWGNKSILQEMVAGRLHLTPLSNLYTRKSHVEYQIPVKERWRQSGKKENHGSVHVADGEEAN